MFQFCFVLIAVGEHNLLQHSRGKSFVFTLWLFAGRLLLLEWAWLSDKTQREGKRSHEKKWKQNFDVDAQPESKLEIYKCAVARVSNTWLSPLSPPLHSELLYFCTHNSSLFTVNCVQIYFPCTRCVYLFHFMRNFSLCASGQKLCMSNESICSVPASHSRYLSRDPVVSCRVLLCCCWQLQFNWVITPVPDTARDKLMARCEFPTHIPYG